MGFPRGRGRFYRRPSQLGGTVLKRPMDYYPLPTTIAAAPPKKSVGVVTLSRYHRHQVQVQAQARARTGRQSAMQPVSRVSSVGRSWANIGSRNDQHANYPRRRCVISMWGSTSGIFSQQRQSRWTCRGVRPRQLPPRPMISFSRSNHHACPSFSSHSRRDPPRGKPGLVPFRCPPRPCPNGQGRAEQDLGPLI